MHHRHYSRRKPRGIDNGATWISYSDMMAALLLMFIMVLVYSIFQYYVMLETKTSEITEKEALLSAQQITLDEQQTLMDSQRTQLDAQAISISQKESELESAQTTLSQQQSILDAQALEISQQNTLLATAKADLSEKENALIIAQQDLSTREQQLTAANTRLETQQNQMAAQQQKIDDLIGVRTDIIRDLSSVFAAQNLRASVDSKTGDIVLESAVFFETGKSNIKSEGQELLARFLPAYLSVLLRDEYKDFLGEITIEGHTDTAGDYVMNLELSQDRALSVAKYCLSMPGLNESQREYLRELLTAKGKSYSSPILNSDGTINMEQSRRVEFKFRLKDSEMIVELNNILKQD